MNIIHNFTRYNKLTVSATRLLAVSSLVALGACSSSNGFIPTFIRPYNMDIQQGNWVTQQQVDSLQKGMSREQVRFALGSPTLADVFHADRWDFPYRFRAGRGNQTDAFTLTVFFENNQLSSWTYDRLPTLQPFQKASPNDAETVSGIKPETSKEINSNNVDNSEAPIQNGEFKQVDL